jgi:hypothetical protein
MLQNICIKVLFRKSVFKTRRNAVFRPSLILLRLSKIYRGHASTHTTEVFSFYEIMLNGGKCNSVQ